MSYRKKRHVNFLALCLSHVSRVELSESVDFYETNPSLCLTGMFIISVLPRDAMV